MIPELGDIDDWKAIKTTACGVLNTIVMYVLEVEEEEDELVEGVGLLVCRTDGGREYFDCVLQDSVTLPNP